jgi:rubrerythrin
MGNEAKSEEAKQKTQNVKSNVQNEKQKFICDRCGFEMFESNCKIICPNCGNRFDCSDLNIYFD